VGAVLLSALGCPRKPAAEPGLTLSACKVKGVTEELLCGDVAVPEDRSQPAGRQLALRVVVAPALAVEAKKDPLFILAGGPGQSATALVDGLLPLFDRVHHTRDLVFVDQRGTGKSAPLQCDLDADGGLGARFQAEPDLQRVRGCLAQLQDGGADVRHYTTPEAMDDLDAVRARLGYDRINLWGGSYGTRAALVYLRQHGDHVRTATIDGVAPQTASLLLSVAEDGQRALDLIFAACAADGPCAAAYPDLKGTFIRLLAALDQAPAHVHVLDPVTGEPADFVLTRAGFVLGLHRLLYVPEISSLLPLIIQRASVGDYGPFVAQGAGHESGPGDLSLGMFYSVVCAEDAPAATPEARAAHNGPGLYLGDAFAKGLSEVCGFWPRGTLPEGYHQPTKADVPVLVLSGELDPVTPPARADEGRVGLTHSKHVIAPGVGHGATAAGCVPQLVARFIDDGQADGLDTTCVQKLKRPPFFVSHAGPVP
jgi:pimeloyl-ACP methyl ester carboxylesterase